VPETPIPAEQVLELLAETPSRLAALTAALTPARLSANPNRGAWSANDVLAHVRACADVWGSCIEAILAEDQLTLRAINPRTWIKQTDYLKLEYRTSLRSFAKQRHRLLAILEPLPPKAWTRSATVTGAGAPLVRSVHSYAQWMATHERSHVKQVGRIVKAMPG
jgi:hypothetical protein